MARPLLFIMSVINPDYHTGEYRRIREDLGSSRDSDIARQLDADLVMMNAQWDVDNAWYNAHQSADARFNELRDLGINDLSAARSVMGNPQNAEHLSAGTISGSGSSGKIQDISNAVGAVAEGLGSVNEAVQTDLAREQTRANVANLDSQTANNVAQNPFIAPKAKSEILYNTAKAEEAEANVGVLNERQNQIIAETELTNEEKNLVSKQVERYDEYTTAQINNWQSQANLYFEEAKTQANVRANLDADTILKGAQTKEAVAHAGLMDSQSQWYIEDKGRIATINEFCAITGCPLDSDMSQRMEYYESKGDYDSAQRLLNVSFDAAAAKDAGSASGSMPYQLYSSEFSEANKQKYSHAKNFREAVIKGAMYADPFKSRTYNPYFGRPSLTY